jgi:prepilin-type N-terminal cleavage/methylation domain-containing protein
MRHQQTGFSLVELLVAIAISMVAMVAATSVYVSSKGTSRLNEMQQRLSEDGRFGNAMLQRIISQAGYRETPSNNIASDRISVTSDGGTSEAIITVKFRTDGANQAVCDGSTPAAADQTLVIRQDGSKLRCGTVEWIAPATAGAGNGTEVMDFYVQMGLDTGPASTNEYLGCGATTGGVKPRDCIVDTYSDALGTNTADQIVAIKVCWVLRSEATDASIVKAALVKDCSNNDIANSKDDRKLYRTFNTTVLLRNR